MNIDNHPLIKHALSIIKDEYGVRASVGAKKKTLTKFGRRTTVGTGWETLTTAQGTETEETFVSDNLITHVVGTGGDEGIGIDIEYHVVDSNGDTFFGIQHIDLDVSDATTPIELPFPAFRISRMKNDQEGDNLTGAVYAYEGGTRTDVNTHAVIPAGEQQTQKASTTISSDDFWIITNTTLTCLAKTTKYVEGRIETKPTSSSVWLPKTQTIGVTDTSGTVPLIKKPFLIIPSNHDIRIPVKSNTSGVDVSAGLSGYLAKKV